MTNEQAKTIIESCDGIMWNRLTDAENEALYMAIEALSNSQKQTDSLIRTSADDVSETDVIYRADAIDAANRADYRGLSVEDVKNVTDEVVKELKRVPSAQPEIIRCKDCKWWDKTEDSPSGYCMAMNHGYISSNWEIGIYRRYKGDFFCADAERRTDG